MTDSPPTPHDDALDEVRRLTQQSTELYATLQTNAERRDALILQMMSGLEPLTAKQISDRTGIQVARIYKLRDNGRARA